MGHLCSSLRSSCSVIFVFLSSSLDRRQNSFKALCIGIFGSASCTFCNRFSAYSSVPLNLCKHREAMQHYAEALHIEIVTFTKEQIIGLIFRLCWKAWEIIIEN